MQYSVDDHLFTAQDYLSLVNDIWPGEYDEKFVSIALQQTTNITAWDNERLIGCVRLLTDGYIFGTIPEILVHPDYQKLGIGRQLMELAWEASPTSLFLGAQPGKEAFFEKLGYTKSLQSYQKKKERKK
ncbi:GNAT family N-acetyltransferase [Fictibacillus nanhaiensis]|nr:GNAT family N-acetyltransferase [Fictibacillus nanhaiensis]